MTFTSLTVSERFLMCSARKAFHIDIVAVTSVGGQTLSIVYMSYSEGRRIWTLQRNRKQ